MSDAPNWSRTQRGTHLPVLVEALALTKGPVLELGAGDWSTPILHQLCWDRELVTVEPVPEWRARFEGMASERHLILSSVCADLETTRWGVVFVDGLSGDRAQHLAMFDADIFVVHDTNKAAMYPDLAEVIDGFPYKHVFSDLIPHTTMLTRQRSVFLSFRTPGLI